MIRAAVVGAGVAGASCARVLRDAGWAVDVFEKSRGAGGRTSTRRRGELRFDHGAQYFTARDPRFARQVDAWRAAGVVSPWEARRVLLSAGKALPQSDDTPRYVGLPGMSALARSLLEGCSLQTGARVTAVRHEEDRWWLRRDAGSELGPYEALVLAVPAPQATPLLAQAPELAERTAAVTVDPCWALLVELNDAPDVPWDAARVEEGPLSWIARNHSKPGRGDGLTWIAHGSPAWTQTHLELEPEEAKGLLLDAFAEWVRATPRQASAHRWRFARTRAPLGLPYLEDPERRLGVCGDWCLGARVEAAYISGLELGGRLTEA